MGKDYHYSYDEYIRLLREEGRLEEADKAQEWLNTVVSRALDAGMTMADLAEYKPLMALKDHLYLEGKLRERVQDLFHGDVIDSLKPGQVLVRSLSGDMIDLLQSVGAAAEMGRIQNDVNSNLDRWSDMVNWALTKEETEDVKEEDFSYDECMRAIRESVGMTRERMSSEEEDTKFALDIEGPMRANHHTGPHPKSSHPEPDRGPIRQVLKWQKRSWQETDFDFDAPYASNWLEGWSTNVAQVMTTDRWMTTEEVQKACQDYNVDNLEYRYPVDISAVAYSLHKCFEFDLIVLGWLDVETKTDQEKDKDMKAIAVEPQAREYIEKHTEFVDIDINDLGFVLISLLETQFDVEYMTGEGYRRGKMFFECSILSDKDATGEVTATGDTKDQAMLRAGMMWLAAEDLVQPREINL